MLCRKAITRVQTIVIIAIIVVASVIGGFAYYTLTTPPPVKEAIKIGIISPVTGGSADLGRRVYQGYQLAAQEINDAGGVLGMKIELILEDSEGKVEKAVSAARKLILTDKVFAIGGLTLSGELMAVAPIAAEYKTILFTSNAATLDFTKLVLDDYAKYKYLWRPCANTSQWVIDWGLSAYEAWNPKYVIWVSDDLKWARETGAGIATIYSERGVKFEEIYLQLGATDFSTEILKIKEKKPDVVIFDTMYSTGVGFASQWYDAKPPVVLYSCLGLTSFDDIIKGLGAKANYLAVNPGVYRVAATSKTIPFWDNFYKRFGYNPDGYNAMRAYDGLLILADAIKRAGALDTDKVIDAIEKTDGFAAASGRYWFTKAHQAEYIKGTIMQWLDGKPIGCLWPPEVATAKYQKPPWW